VRRGLVLGKFLPYHAGHAHLIRTARAQVDELVVLVCSLESEPIPGRARLGWVSASHQDCRIVHVSEEVPQAPEEHPDFWPIWTDLIERYAGRVDVVFTSEAYGDTLATCLGARHISVDPGRLTFPVSGTAIRNDPVANWEYIPAVVRPSYAHRVALLGAESTGKTTLAIRLAERFGTTWVPEFGRAYCEQRDALELTLDDFDVIARGQIEAEDAAARLANRVLLCDTDVRTTATWSDLVRGTRSEWLARTAAVREYSHVILMADDVPWVDDGTRVLRDRRAQHTALLEAELRSSQQPFTRVGGGFEERFEQAAAVVGRVLRTPVKPRFE
jgi:NadR type nicotinamide-nucleotide adenylyltransferase